MGGEGEGEGGMKEEGRIRVSRWAGQKGEELKRGEGGEHRLLQPLVQL